MTKQSITAAQRYTRGRPCPICGGFDAAPRGHGKRCSGYRSADGEYAYCTREEYAGAIEPNTRTAPPAFAHRLHGDCRCGVTHGPALAAPQRSTPAPRTRRGGSALSSSAASASANANAGRPGNMRYIYTEPAPVPSPAAGSASSSSAPVVPDALARVTDPAEGVEAAEAVTSSSSRQDAGEQLRTLTATYDYRDAAGALVFQVLRYQLTDSATGEVLGKTFRQRRPDPERRGAWLWNLDGVTRPPYRLRELLATAAEDPAAGIPVYLCEGEKDAEALAALGLCATTTAQGARSWEKSAEGARAALAGRHVVILPDNDTDGALYADMAARALDGIAASVRVLALAAADPGVSLAAHGDVSDWLAAGGTAERLAQLAAAAPAYVPAPEPEPAPRSPAPALDGLDGTGRGGRGRSRRGQDAGGPTGEDELAGALYLRDTRYGALWYAPDADVPGLYVMPRRGAPYCILSARVDPLRAATHPGARAGRGSVYHLVFTPDLAPTRPVTVQATRDAAMAGALYTDSGLENLCSHTPADKTDLALAWQAITSLVSHVAARTPALRVRTAPGLSWYEGAWARLDGYIDGEGAHVGGDIIVSGVSPDWPQSLPAAPELLPSTLDAGLVRELLAFWPQDVSLYPLVLWGACAYIMVPYTEGRASWELEVFGPTGSGKTALTNAALRAFFGSGYTFDTGTQLTNGREGDTPIGRLLMRSRLRGHAYMTYDHNAKQGEPDYDKQQQDRIESADATGNKVQGGAKGTRDGGVEMRPAPQGLLIRTGEGDPHDYSITHRKASSDARCVTFVLDVGLGELDDEALAKSKAIFARAAELDALSIAYTQWLAQLAAKPAEAVEQWHTIRAHVARLVGQIDCSGEYPMRHPRVLGQCEDIAAGLTAYALFLRAADLDTGTAQLCARIRGGAQLAEDLARTIPALIRERLAASHELMQRHAEAAGGASAREAQAAAFLAWLSDKVYDGVFYLSGQRTDTPRAAPVSWAAMGYDRNRITGAYEANPRARRLGALSDDGRYVILDNTTLDTIARQAARDVKAVTYTTLQRFKADLLAAGAIEGTAADPEHRFARHVRLRERDPQSGEEREALRWRVHLVAARLWPQSDAICIDNPTSPDTTDTTDTTDTKPACGEQETAIQAEWGAEALDAGEAPMAANLVTGKRTQTDTKPAYGDVFDGSAEAFDAGADPGAERSSASIWAAWDAIDDHTREEH